MARCAICSASRALYRASEEPRQRERVAAIGQELRQALDLARRSGAGTLGRQAVWSRAERATAALGEIVADVRAAATRLGGR